LVDYLTGKFVKLFILIKNFLKKKEKGKYYRIPFVNLKTVKICILGSNVFTPKII